MKPKKAISLLILEDFNKDIDRFFNILSKNKIQFVELPLSKLFNNFKYNKKIANNFKKKLKNYKIAVSSIQSIFYGKYFNILNKKHHKKIINHIETICMISKKFNAKNLIFGSPKNRLRGKMSKIEADLISVNIFRKISDVCKKYKINFCLEPNASFYGCDYINTLDHAENLIKHVKRKNFLLNIDTGNISLEENIKCIPKIKKQLIGNFQVSEKNLKKLKPTNHKHIRILKKFYTNSKFVSLEQLNIKFHHISHEIKKFNKIIKRINA